MARRFSERRFDGRTDLPRGPELLSQAQRCPSRGRAFFSPVVFLSKAFGIYVSNFGYYNKVTGILGVFIVLLLWIYLTALFLLIGGELNAELSHKEGR